MFSYSRFIDYSELTACIYFLKTQTMTNLFVFNYLFALSAETFTMTNITQIMYSNNWQGNHNSLRPLLYVNYCKHFTNYNLTY